MNAIRETTFAASALAITLIGAAWVTAPMVFARQRPVTARDACSMPSLQLTLSGHVGCYGTAGGAGLIALNR
ncbi:MAG: hypothetical protein ACRETZ_12310, partial [Steroidobacteraceae bacterium]